MPVLSENLNLGDVLKYEAPNLYSRDQVTVAAGNNVPLGTVVGQVTATGLWKPLDPTATDGTKVAAGIVAIDIDATLMDRRDAVLIARHAIVSEACVLWPAGLTAPQKATAIAQLKALGILIRRSA